MAKKTKPTVKDKQWLEVQADIQNRIDDDLVKITKVFEHFNANETFVTYFLMYWTRVLEFSKRQDKGYSNREVIDTIKDMMAGDLPPQVDFEETRTLN